MGFTGDPFCTSASLKTIVIRHIRSSDQIPLGGVHKKAHFAGQHLIAIGWEHSFHSDSPGTIFHFHI